MSSGLKRKADSELVPTAETVTESEEPKSKVQKKDDEIVIKNTNHNYTHDEWINRLKFSLESGVKEEITKEYEEYLLQYVNDGDQWTEYIKWMMNEKVEEIDKKKIESSFFKVLTKVYNINLWKLYLEYVEKINPITPDNGEKARSIVLKAYKFAIDTVGIDFFKSHEIWKAYLNYLYLWQAVNSNEVSTREDLIRKALKKMISYPSLNLEENWNIYTKFETDINLSKSKKIISDSKIEYLKLKDINDELIKLTKSIKIINQRKYSLRQVKRWNEWINWEKENKLRLNEEELNKRINYVYNLSVQYCRLLPEMWFNYSNYKLNDRNDEKNSIEIIKDGIKVNPYSLILTYELSNYYENKNNIEEIKNTWIELISRIENNVEIKDDRLITYCYCNLMKIIKRTSNIKEVRTIFKIARQYKGIGWNIYSDYSMIEYYNNDNKIASRAFSLAMQTFNKEILFIMKYLEFLINVKDMSNFKKIIEISIETFKEDNKALKMLFIKYFEVEEEFGDIRSINNLRKRYQKIFKENTPFDLILQGSNSKDDKFNGIKELDEYKKSIGDERNVVEIIEEEDREKSINVNTTTNNDIDIGNLIEQLNGGNGAELLQGLYNYLQSAMTQNVDNNNNNTNNNNNNNNADLDLDTVMGRLRNE